MIGVDIVLISRFQESYLDIASRFLSDSEREEMKSYEACRQVTYVASRFAGKEAYIKASSSKKAKLSDIEILNSIDGKPHLYYKKKECGEISLSHDEYCVAFVLLNKKEDN